MKYSRSACGMISYAELFGILHFSVEQIRISVIVLFIWSKAFRFFSMFHCIGYKEPSRRINHFYVPHQECAVSVIFLSAMSYIKVGSFARSRMSKLRFENNWTFVEKEDTLRSVLWPSRKESTNISSSYTYISRNKLFFSNIQAYEKQLIL